MRALTTSQTRDAAESAIARSLACADARGALDELWRAYGAEVFGWLVAVHGPVDAADICGSLALTLVKAMPSFRGESSARTWLYQIARNEAHQHHRAALRRRALLTPLDGHPSAEQRPVPRSSGRQRELERLRRTLCEEDRSLLVLRLDRGLSYAEIAAILFGDGEDEEIERGAARLRQRVRDLREKLRRRSMESE